MCVLHLQLSKLQCWVFSSSSGLKVPPLLPNHRLSIPTPSSPLPSTPLLPPSSHGDSLPFPREAPPSPATDPKPQARTYLQVWPAFSSDLAPSPCKYEVFLCTVLLWLPGPFPGCLITHPAWVFCLFTPPSVLLPLLSSCFHGPSLHPVK